MAANQTIRHIDYPPHRPHSLGHLVQSVVKTVGNRLEQWFNPIHEPTIVKRNNQHNIPYWEVYDPRTKQTIYCASEAELGLWLDRLAHTEVDLVLDHTYR